MLIYKNTDYFRQGNTYTPFTAYNAGNQNNEDGQQCTETNEYEH